MKKIAITLVGMFILLIGTNAYTEVDVLLKLNSTDGTITAMERLSSGFRINKMHVTDGELSDNNRDGVYDKICFPVTEETISAAGPTAN